MTTALDPLRTLHTSSQLLSNAGAAVERLPVAFNAHVHLPPNFSAFQSIGQAVELASEQGCALLGSSNYYDFTAYSELASRCQQKQIFPLFGLEMLCRDEDLARRGLRVNDPGNPGKVYLCGKGLGAFDPLSPKASAILARLRSRDGARMAEMVRLCSAILAERGCPIDLTADAILDALAARLGCPRRTIVLQERHVAQAFQEGLFKAIPPKDRLSRLPELLGGPCKLKGADDAVGTQNELRSHLMKSGKPAFVPEGYLDVAEAKTLALELGGIPSYPVLADGASPITQFEATPASVVGGVKGLGIWATEFIPNRNVPALLVEYVKTVRASGLIVTCGTEHNTQDLLPIMPSAKGAPVPPELLPLFWEGACVCAAHQYFVARGEPGYVTPEGALNPSYPDPESRISAFAALGRTVIAAFRNL